MSRKTDAAREDHAVRLYLAGESLDKIKSETGVSGTLLQRIRQRRGIPPRPRHPAIPHSSVVRAYIGGASEYALARQYGVSRGTIARILVDHGVPRRGMSEAGVVRNENLTPDQRRKQVAAANKASRVRKMSNIDKARRAVAREWQALPESEGERLLYNMLDGYHPRAQRAIGPYNVDIAMPPVAVEILGGRWHATKATHRERTPYILDQGWHLVMVWNTSDGHSALGCGAAEYIVAFADEMRRNPPATCQYRVISGDGQLLAARGREDGEFPVVPPPRGSLN